MSKKCTYIQYQIKVYLENYGCGSNQSINGEEIICSPRNARLSAFGPNDDPENSVYGDPHRLVITAPHLVHILCDHPTVRSDCIKLSIERGLACQDGCDSAWYGVPVCFLGSGMLLPAGEYVISIPDQVAHCVTHEDLGAEVEVMLIVEPFSRDMLDAAMYNRHRG